jgi:hypothetical protein
MPRNMTLRIAHPSHALALALVTTMTASTVREGSEWTSRTLDHAPLGHRTGWPAYYGAFADGAGASAPTACVGAPLARIESTP